MKISPRDAESFLRTAPASVAVVLLYGNDSGLVSERARALARLVLGPDIDPFRISELDGEVIEGEPRRLVEEAQSLCLMGGRRIVRVRSVRDRAARGVEVLLGQDPIEAFVVLEAAELGPGAKLRQLAERSANAAAIGCWHDEGRDLGSTIRDIGNELGLSFDRDAMAWLMDHLGGDRLVTRRELEKIALYVGEGAGGGRIGLDTVSAVVGDSSAFALDELCLAALSGDDAKVERLLDRLFAAGEAPFRIVRALGSSALRYARIRSTAGPDVPLETVVANLKPPVHFRARPVVVIILNCSNTEALLQVVEACRLCEQALKRARAPAEVLARRLCFETAVRIRHRADRTRQAS